MRSKADCAGTVPLRSCMAARTSRRSDRSSPGTSEALHQCCWQRTLRDRGSICGTGAQSPISRPLGHQSRVALESRETRATARTSGPAGTNADTAPFVARGPPRNGARLTFAPRAEGAGRTAVVFQGCSSRRPSAGVPRTSHVASERAVRRPTNPGTFEPTDLRTRRGALPTLATAGACHRTPADAATASRTQMARRFGRDGTNDSCARQPQARVFAETRVLLRRPAAFNRHRRSPNSERARRGDRTAHRRDRG
jgi:hypothetical protein